MEAYNVRLEREINEMKHNNPYLEKIINVVKEGMKIRNNEIDYEIEREYAIYKNVDEILNKSK